MRSLLIILSVFVTFAIVAQSVENQNTVQVNTFSDAPSDSSAMHLPAPADSILLSADSISSQADSTLSQASQILTLNDSIELVKKEIKDLDKDLNTYRDSVMSISFAMLKIPYDEFMINELAIPIYEGAAKDSLQDKKIQGRLSLMKSYKDDSTAVKEILTKLSQSLNEVKDEESLKKWAVNKLSDFKIAPVVKEYSEKLSEEESRDSFLGSIIVNTQKLLENQNYPDALNKIKNSLKVYLDCLK